MKVRLKIFSVLVIVLGMYSCDYSRVYDTWKEMPSTGWNKDSVYTFNAYISDTLVPMNIVLGVRNTNAYSQSNLWTFVSTQNPYGIIKRDTFEMVLASPYGDWYGSGWGNIFTSLHYYKTNQGFPASGNYTFTIQHGMRKDMLEGIQAIGIRIEKVEE